jgi:hypothetical protein
MSHTDFTGATWRKSTHSGGNSGQCVEVASMPFAVGIRDSKNPAGPSLAFSRAEFGRMVHGIKDL